MKKTRSKNAKPLTILIILSALLALSGMAAIVSADEPTPVTNIFYGTAFDGEWVESGTVITAYVGGEAEPRGSSTTDDYSRYYIDVQGDASVDGGKEIVFKVGDSVAEPTATWVASIQSQEHNLRVGAASPDTPPPQPPADDDTSNGGGTSGGSGGSTTTTGTDTSTSDESAAAGDDATTPTTTTAETATTSSTEETSGTDDAEPEERSFPWFVVLVIAGLLVVAIIAYLAKKR